MSKHRFALVLSAAAGLSALFAATLFQPGWKVIAWNDLGMHCMDGDYSVFSLLPPYNTLRAQVVDPTGKLLRDTTGFRVTYEGVADPSGSINKTSTGKTDFWQRAQELYGGSSTVDVGLAGFDMPGPSNLPRAMRFEAATSHFIAEGIPITPYDDAGHKRPYPMMRVVVRDAANNELAATRVVLPVSDEMDCTLCHASEGHASAMPRNGWLYDRDYQRDFRRNILMLHDDLQMLRHRDLYKSVLAQAGYSSNGLHDTAVNQGKAVLCARCHKSNALPGSGLAGVSDLTHAIHGYHANVEDPITHKRLDDLSNRASCYRCHPGSETRCLRGAMGSAVATSGDLAIQCQDCHGKLSTVADTQRQGWLDQPSCQNCHTGTAVKNNGQIRYTSVYDNGTRRKAVDATFATNDDVPAKGYNLYRFSIGHGGLQCEACHGSTHAEYPSSHGNDNVQSVGMQGHVGTLAECTACHARSPDTVTGGPHGMHPLGQVWVDDHGDAVEKLGTTGCTFCHGGDYRGTVLSTAHGDRTFQTRYGQKTFARGARVSCWACHKGPTSDDVNPNRPPVAQAALSQATTSPVQVPLVASDPDANPLTLRIVTQPAAGRVGLVGNTATYYPDPGFAGDDVFTFLAWDGAIDSNLGVVTVTRGAVARNYGTGYPGTGGLTPIFAALSQPKLGTTTNLAIVNTVGVPTVVLFVASSEPARLRTGFGGALLTEPVLIVAASLPMPGALLPLAVPNDARLIGARLCAQVIEYDPGARFAFAFSQGLELMLGL
jgi:hypothetical protein